MRRLWPLHETALLRRSANNPRRHTSEDFLSFMAQIAERTQGSKEIHIVLDNLSAHKMKSVAAFLDQNPRVRFHFTPA